MKHFSASHIVAFLAMCAMSAGVFSATEAASASEPLSSTKDRGVVSLVADPALSQGRLVLKVVAFNRTRDPVAFGVADVQIATTAGKAVGIVPLDRLIEEVTKTSGSRPSASPGDHNPSDYSHPGVSTSGAGGAGEPDLGGYTGGANPTSGVVSAHTRASDGRGSAATGNAAQDEVVASLKAGILQSMIIPSASAAGGQVVTEKLKFARKEERSLRVLVDFNGEQHEFTVAVPQK